MNKLAFLTMLLLMVGCGGSSGDGDSDSADDINSTDNIDTEFVGIWDQTEDFGSDGTDEIYLSIASDGSGAIYDYDGDTFDQGDNCYFIFRNTIQLERSGANYNITDSDFIGSLLVDLAIEGEDLTFTVLEDNASYDAKKGEKGTLGKKTSGLSATDFDNMECN